MSSNVRPGAYLSWWLVRTVPWAHFAVKKDAKRVMKVTAKRLNVQTFSHFEAFQAYVFQQHFSPSSERCSNLIPKPWKDLVQNTPCLMVNFLQLCENNKIPKDLRILTHVYTNSPSIFNLYSWYIFLNKQHNKQTPTHCFTSEWILPLLLHFITAASQHSIFNGLHYHDTGIQSTRYFFKKPPTMKIDSRSLFRHCIIAI